MNTWKCGSPLKQQERIRKKILRDSPVKYQRNRGSLQMGALASLLYHFLSTEKPEKLPWPTSSSHKPTHLPDCCLQRFPTHSPREEPPGLSFSTFQGSSPCCNREITSGLENGSPAHSKKKKKKKKDKKIQTTTNSVLTQRGNWFWVETEDEAKSFCGVLKLCPCDVKERVREKARDL